MTDTTHCHLCSNKALQRQAIHRYFCSKQPKTDCSKRPKTDCSKRPKTDCSKKPKTDCSKKPKTDFSKQPKTDHRLPCQLSGCEERQLTDRYRLPNSKGQTEVDTTDICTHVCHDTRTTMAVQRLLLLTTALLACPSRSHNYPASPTTVAGNDGTAGMSVTVHQRPSQSNDCCW